MKVSRRFLSLALLITTAGYVEAIEYDLPMCGKLPHPGSDWTVREDDGVRGDYSWVNLESPESGDVLSFVAWKFGSSEVKVSHDPVGQASIETFRSDGSARFTSNAVGISIADTVRHRIVTLTVHDRTGDRRLREEAIEYTYIYEPSGESPATIAHGYVVVVGDVVLFVQHTSERIITSELAASMAYGLLHQHLEKRTSVGAP